MERRFPLIDIDVGVAERLLAPLRRTSSVGTIELLSGGHRNTNYVVTFEDGARVVLRLYAAGEPAFRKEAGLLESLPASLPVPRLHLARLDTECFEHPYTVTEWIDGVPLPSVLSSSPEAGAQIGEAIAASLQQIRNLSIKLSPSVPLTDFIRDCLFERDARRHLGGDAAARLVALIQRQDALIRELTSRQGLVHGDFQGDNILLRRGAGQWRVAAVLDWEWARNGSYLVDLGSLLRLQTDTSAAFEQGLESGFDRGGDPLPEEWRMVARIIDLAAHCEKLTYRTHRGDVTRRSIAIIERCLRDYAQ